MALQEELDLDFAGALSGVDTLGAAFDQVVSSLQTGITESLDAANTPIELNADATGVTDAIDEAVASADPSVTVDQVEAGTVTDAIDAAVEASDASPIIDSAEATGVTAAIDDAVEAANTEIELTADAAGLEDAAGATSQLGTAADGAQSSVSGLGAAAAGASLATSTMSGGATGLTNSLRVLGPVGVAAGAALGTIFSVGVTVEASYQRLERATGSFAERLQSVKIGDFNATFSELSADLGIGGSAMREIAASTFEFGKRSGFTGEASAQFANNINSLAVVLSTTNPRLGEASDLAEKLPRALAKGGQFAGKLGISLSKVEVSARASENAIKGIGNGVDAASLQFAGAQLAAERLGKKGLKESIEDASKNPVVQMRVLETAVRGFLAEAGRPLVAPGLEFFKASAPSIAAATSAIGTLASGALPILTLGFQAFGVAASGVSKVVSAIPEPVLQLGIAFALLSKAQSLIVGSKIVASLVAMGTAATASAAAQSVAAGASVVNAAAANGMSVAAVRAAVAQNALAASSVSAAAGASTLSLVLKGITAQLVGFVTGIARVAAPLAAVVVGLREAFNNDLLKGGGVLGQNIPIVGNLTGAFERNAKALSSHIPILGKWITGNDDAGKSAEDTGKKLSGAAVEAEKLAAAELRYANAVANRGADSKKAQDALAAVTRLQREQGTTATDAATAVDTSAAAVARAAIQQSILSSTLGGSAAGWNTLAGAVSLAGPAFASSEQVARAFGLSAAEIKPIVDGIAASLTAFTDGAISKLPGVADAFTEATAKSQISGQAFVANLEQNIVDVASFTANLKTIIGAGFTDVAALIAQTGPEVGAQVAADIAQGITEGGSNADIAGRIAAIVDPTGAVPFDEFKALMAQLGLQVSIDGGVAGRLVGETTGTAFTGSAVAAINQGTGPIVAAANAAGFSLGAGFASGSVVSVPTAVRDAMVAAGVAVDSNKTPLITAWGDVGKQSSVKLTEDFDPAAGIKTGTDKAAAAVSGADLEGPSGGKGKKAGEALGTNYSTGVASGVTAGENTIRGAAEGVTQRLNGGLGAIEAGRNVGGNWDAGFAAGIVGNAGIVRAAAQSVADTLSGGLGARDSGANVGRNFVAGMAAGIDANSGIVSAAARRAVLEAKAAADAAARNRSPSKLFAEVGKNIVAGLAIGIGSNSDLATKALTSIIDDLATTSIKPVTLQAAVATGGSSGGGSVASVQIAGATIEVSVTGPMSSQQATDLGTTIGQSAGDAFADTSSQKIKAAIRAMGAQ